MKSSFFTIVFFSFYIFSISSFSYSQINQAKPLIDIPGDNYDFDVYSTSDYYQPPAFITWINKSDSSYTIYFKQLSPKSGQNIVVVSDTNFKSNPQIANDLYSTGIRITWEEKIGNYWKIKTAAYNDSLSNVELIKDSILNNPQITTNITRIFWIDNSALYMKYFLRDSINTILIDSSNCSSPDVSTNNNISTDFVVYEKSLDSQKVIIFKQYNGYYKSWITKQFSSGKINLKPRFGLFSELAYQSLIDSIWKISFTPYIHSNYFDTSKNISCNYENPINFSYPLTTSQEGSDTPFFVVFDTDSLPNNKEILMRTTYIGGNSKNDLVNISNAEGDDTKPDLAFVSIGDTVYVDIIWEHSQNNKTDIWDYLLPYHPISADVKDGKNSIYNFKLAQNYPNPFNPTTTISFTLYKTSKISLKIYNSLGQLVNKLFDKEFSAGNHHYIWNAKDLPSGIYYLKLKSDEHSEVKKAILLK